MGMIASMIAGGAKKVADGRVADIEQREEYDLKAALLDAQMDKELRLKESGYQMDKAHEVAEHVEVKAITDSVNDPFEAKGGYEDDAAKTKRDYDLVQQKVDKLTEAGKYDAAKQLQIKLDKIDTKNNKEAMLELKTLIAENNFKNQTGLLSLKQEGLEQQGKIADAKNETQLARIDASNAKGGSNNSTAEDRRYAAYVESVKTNGRKDRQGKVSKIPMDYDSWWAYYNNNPKQNDSDTIVEKTTSIDNEGNEVTRSKTSKAINKPKTVSKEAVKTYDPKTRTFK